MTDRPWMKFYPADWRSDPALRMCSLAARGLWIEMLSIMHEAKPYGYLLVKGRAPTDAQLAVLAGTSSDQIAELLAELEAADVFSRTRERVIYSRRMTTDEKKARKARQNGKSGGNPSLRNKRENPASDNPPDKRLHKGRDKPRDARDPEARGQNPPYSPPSDDGSSQPALAIDPEERFEDFWTEVPRKVGKGQAEKAWRKAVKLADPDALIAAMRRHAKAMEGKEQQFIPHPATWLNGKRWLDQEAQPPPTANGHDPEPSFTGDDSQWNARVKGYTQTGNWFDMWGPKPDQPRCQAPAHILERHGYGHQER